MINRKSLNKAGIVLLALTASLLLFLTVVAFKMDDVCLANGSASLSDGADFKVQSCRAMEILATPKDAETPKAN